MTPCCGTAGFNSILRDNLKTVKKSIYAGTTSFIRDPVARVVATECLTLKTTSFSFTSFLERFYQQLKADATDSSTRGRAAWDLTMEVFLQIWKKILPLFVALLVVSKLAKKLLLLTFGQLFMHNE